MIHAGEHWAKNFQNRQLAVGQKRVPKKPIGKRKNRPSIDPATCGPPLDFLFDP